MKKQTSKYFKELANYRWKKQDTPPEVTEGIRQDLHAAGTRGGNEGGNKFSEARRQAFAKGNKKRWGLFRYLHGLRKSS